MSLFDKAKDAAEGALEKVKGLGDEALDKAGDLVHGDAEGAKDSAEEAADKLQSETDVPHAGGGQA